MSIQSELVNHNLNIEGILANKPLFYKVELVDESVIKEYEASHPESHDNSEVGVIKWSDSGTQFTFGASPCIVPVITHRNNSTNGIGHLDYSPGHNPTTTREGKALISARQKLIPEPGEWEVSLFGGSPVSLNEKYTARKKNKVKEVTELFSYSGITCHDCTTPDPNLTVRGLIIDSENRRIQVCYTVK